MAIPAVPVIGDLPPAPTRSDGAADFTPKADAMIGALQPLVVQVNIATQWMNGRLTDAQAAQAAAAASATAAADSATLAGQKVGLAADQVGLATTQANNAAASAISAQAYAQAAGAAVGPPPVANRFLGTDGAGVPGWKEIVIPPAFSVGDILDSSRTLTVPDWLTCDGAVYLQASYPALFAKIGAASKAFQPPITLSAPSVPPTNSTNCVAISADDTYIAIGNTGGGAKNLNVYKKSGDVLTDLTITFPGDGSNSVSGVAFSPDGVYLAVSHATTPRITIYKRSGDVFTKLADPATLPAAAASSVAFSQDGVHLAVGHANAPRITIYKRSGDVFTKLADPANLPTVDVAAVKFSPNGDYLVIGMPTAAGIFIYKRSGDVFTKLADPAITNSVTGFDFSDDSNYLAVSSQTAPFVMIYKRSGDVFTKLADPATLPANQMSSPKFTKDMSKLAFVGPGASGVIYSRSGDVFASIFTSLLTANGMTFSNDNRYLVAARNTSPYIGMYREAPYITATEFVVPALTQPGTFATIKRYIKA